MTEREQALLWLDSFRKNKEPMTLIPKSLIRLMYAVLKNEEAIEPIEDEDGDFLCGRGRCSCVGSRRQNKIVRLCNFCPVCGKAVKWDA